MCYFEQTQYLACGHNVEIVTEKCELGEKYRTSMHDKIITAVHSNDGQCEMCNPPPAYSENTNGVVSDIPDVAPAVNNTPTNIKENLIDLTNDAEDAEKRPPRQRRDSKTDDLMDLS